MDFWPHYFTIKVTREVVKGQPHVLTLKTPRNRQNNDPRTCVLPASAGFPLQSWSNGLGRRQISWASGAQMLSRSSARSRRCRRFRPGPENAVKAENGSRRVLVARGLCDSLTRKNPKIGQLFGLDRTDQNSAPVSLLQACLASAQHFPTST